MQATRIIALRHGETTWNVDTRIQGQLDIPLNATGEWQVARLGAALAGETLDAIYSSDLMRAFETALAVALPHGAVVVADHGLREREFGVFQGRTFAEIEATWPDQALRWRQRDPSFAPEGGESLLVFRGRVVAAASRLAALHPDQQIALVAHGGVMDVLYREATGQDLQAPRTWALGNAAINRLLWAPNAQEHGGFRVVGWADTRHLEQGALDEVAA